MSLGAGKGLLAIKRSAWAGMAVCLVLLALGRLYAQTSTPETKLYQSALEFSLEYPADWRVIDRTSTSSIRNEFRSLNGKYDPAFIISLEQTIVNVEKKEITAAFFDPQEQRYLRLIKLCILPGTKKLDTNSLPAMEIAMGRVCGFDWRKAITNKADVLDLGEQRCLSLHQTFARTDSTPSYEVYGHLLKGRERTFLLSCIETGSKDTALNSVVSGMTRSFRELRVLYQGLLTLPRWEEMAFIAIFAIVIVLLVRKMIQELRVSPKSKYDRRGRGIRLSFLPAVLLVVVLLFAAIMLTRSCMGITNWAADSLVR